MKRKNKALTTFFIILVSICIIFCVFYIVLNNTGKINQGMFRTNDAIITSIVTVEEKQANQQESMISDLQLDLSQKNVLSMLVTKDSKIKEIYLDNIKTTFPSLKGKMYITQPNVEQKYELIDDMNKVNIYSQDKDNQYLIEIEIDNCDFSTDVKVPEDMQVVRFDGTLLNVTGINVEDLMFKIKFNLNIVDENDKVNVCKINMNVPGYELANSGIGVTRENLSNYVFSLKNNLNLNFFK